jgi:hypothetical protein
MTLEDSVEKTIDKWYSGELPLEPLKNEFVKIATQHAREETMEYRKALVWLFSDDTGLSSESIMAHMLGIRKNWSDAPSDDADRGRCVRLLKIFPEWIPRLDELKGSGWEEQIPLLKKELDNLGGK